jgi:hypothetical protein
MQKNLIWGWLAAGVFLVGTAAAQDQRQAPQAMPAPGASKLVPATKIPSLMTKAQTAAPSTPKGPQPVIACDQPDFDLGSVGEGEDIKHVYVIKNKGKAPLKILSARGG